MNSDTTSCMVFSATKYGCSALLACISSTSSTISLSNFPFGGTLTIVGGPLKNGFANIRSRTLPPMPMYASLQPVFGLGR